MVDKSLCRSILLTEQLLRPSLPDSHTTLEVIQKLSYIQIDSLNIVHRAHHHTLWNRASNYDLETLNTLVREKQVFEYWSHAAAYLPMHEYRFALVQMNAIKRGKSHYVKEVNQKDIQYVLDRIQDEGSLKARDFKSTSPKQGSWWNWKPYKNALERLFMEGELMSCRRDGMEKVYDLKSRVLPSNIDTQEPTPDIYAHYLIESTLRAHGIASFKQIIHLRADARMKKRVQNILQQRVRERTLESVMLEGSIELFALPSALDTSPALTQNYLKILSPFDNAVIHREKLLDVFGFDYKIECYTPKDQRVYGYFCLPILFNDAFVARVDCKAHRTEGVLEIIHLHLEENFQDIELFAYLFAKEIQKYASFNGCSEIMLKYVSPSKYHEPITQALA